MWARHIFILGIIAIANTSIGQTTEVLQLKGKYYTEQNIISLKPRPNLVQENCHDDPEVTDDDFCLHLQITFLDLARARQLKTLDVNKDTLVIKCQFYSRSIWNYGDTTFLKGTISILSWTRKLIELNFSLNIESKGLIRTRAYAYYGRRIFRPKTH
jgi:hypothetical protein